MLYLTIQYLLLLSLLRKIFSQDFGKLHSFQISNHKNSTKFRVPEILKTFLSFDGFREFEIQVSYP